MMRLLDKIKAWTGTPRVADVPALSTPAVRAPNESGAPASTARPTERPRNTVDDLAGLPSVNRRQGNSRVVTQLGFLLILAAAMALIVGTHGERAPRPKTGRDDPVANHLPPLTSVDTGPPRTTPLAPAAGMLTVPALQPVNPTLPAFAVRGAAPGAPETNGKPPIDAMARKTGGNLLIASSTAVSAPATKAGSTTPDAAAMAPSRAIGTPLTGTGSATALSARLAATPTHGVAAALLADRNFLITQGTALDCVLETALDSTLPGLATCRLTRDVYSDNGQVLLLDRGSQLVGEYQGSVKQGQARLFVLWTRAKTPNGVIVTLNSPGTDALGRSGLAGWVDQHFLDRFGAAILMSVIKDSVTALANRQTGSNGTTNIYGSAGASGEKVVEKILEASVNIAPTLIKNQGEHIQVMVARDLDFSSVYGLQAAP